MTEVQAAQQILMATQTPPVGPCYKVILDALAEVLQQEGAQEFQYKFFEHVNQHGSG